MKVLIVDDNQDNLDMIGFLLKSNNYTVNTALNGKIALEILRTEKYDLIISDILMPVMDGYEATSRIRKLPEFSHLPIIALTAKAMKEDRKKCLDAGASDYLSKPVDQDKLISLIRVWLCR